MSSAWRLFSRFPPRQACMLRMLRRYPVKSLLGERMPTLRLIDDGVEGDPACGAYRIAADGESPDSIVYNAPDTVPK
jgi:hypothetical protein